MTKLWGGRFAEEPAEAMLAFTASIGFDRVLVREDCRVLTAHARALARAGILSDEEASSVGTALDTIASDIESGGFALTEADEDIHTAVERALLERLPDVAPKVRAGLSRNDRVATALRLWLLRQGRGLVADLGRFIRVLADRADESRDVLVPGYTHLQRAQPVRLAHHLLAHAFALDRDARRFIDALRRTDASPLGAGALAGSTLGLDADGASIDLGFSTSMPNSLDAVAARDFVAEFLAASAICAVHLSRIGEEIVLWSSEEFGFASLADSYATGSSLMPQKKNPDIAELARGKAGRVIGDLTGVLAMLKGLPLAYNRDLQEDKEPLFDAVGTLRGLIPVLGEAIRTMTFHGDVMGHAAASGTLLATDLAEYLVSRGVAFRRAHEIVGKVVQRALSQGKSLADLDLEELKGLSDAFDGDVREVLSARASVDRRRQPGPSATSLDDQLQRIRMAVMSLGDEAPPG